MSLGPTRFLVPELTRRKFLFEAPEPWATFRCAGHTYAEPVLGLPGALPVPALGRLSGGVSVFKGPGNPVDVPPRPTGFTTADAQDDFLRARRHAALSRLVARLRR